MSKLAEWIRHNQGMAVSVIILIGVGIWTFGCESMVTSIIDSELKVNRQELALEITAERVRLEAKLDDLIQRAELKGQKLDRMDAVKQKLLNFAAITADAGTVNPAGVVGLLFSVVGIGAVIDNRLKDKVIKNRPLKANDRGDG